jgi:hypothetical protein
VRVHKTLSQFEISRPVLNNLIQRRGVTQHSQRILINILGRWPFYRGTLSQLLFQLYSFFKNRERHDEINIQKYTNKCNLTYITVNKSQFGKTQLFICQSTASMLGTIIIDELLSCHTTVYTILRWRFEKLDYFFLFLR